MLEGELKNRNTVKVDNYYVGYGRIPSGLIEGWNEIVFYFTTSEEELFNDINKYEKIIQQLIDRLKYQNDESEHGVSWRETRKEAVEWNKYCQITLVSFRVRDSY